MSVDTFTPIGGTGLGSAVGCGSAFRGMVVLQLGQPYFTQALNMAAIGDGRAYLGGGNNGEVAYMASTLGAGLTDAWTPAGVAGVYRIAPATSSFSFQGVDNVLTGNNYLQVGNQRNMVVGTVTNGGNILVIRNSNNYSGGTQITSGSSIYIETGGRASGSMTGISSNMSR